jgi:hypothetical protein
MDSTACTTVTLYLLDKIDGFYRACTVVTHYSIVLKQLVLKHRIAKSDGRCVSKLGQLAFQPDRLSR